jgi:hypothetical protein
LLQLHSLPELQERKHNVVQHAQRITRLPNVKELHLNQAMVLAYSTFANNQIALHTSQIAQEPTVAQVLLTAAIRTQEPMQLS